MRHTAVVLFVSALFLSASASSVQAASVVINEFLANPTTPAKEWVEFYNPEHTDLSTYWLDDDPVFNDDSGSSAKKNLATPYPFNNSNPDYPFLEYSGFFLNNDGDYVVLFSPEGTVLDQYQYTENPGKDISIGRNPNGTGEWKILVSATQGQPNSSPLQIPTPSPTPTSASASTPTPTPTPKPTTKPTSPPTLKPSSSPSTISVIKSPTPPGDILLAAASTTASSLKEEIATVAGVISGLPEESLKKTSDKGQTVKTVMTRIFSVLAVLSVLVMVGSAFWINKKKKDII